MFLIAWQSWSLSELVATATILFTLLTIWSMFCFHFILVARSKRWDTNRKTRKLENLYRQRISNVGNSWVLHRGCWFSCARIIGSSSCSVGSFWCWLKHQVCTELCLISYLPSYLDIFKMAHIFYSSGNVSSYQRLVYDFCSFIFCCNKTKELECICMKRYILCLLLQFLLLQFLLATTQVKISMHLEWEIEYSVVASWWWFFESFSI